MGLLKEAHGLIESAMSGENNDAESTMYATIAQAKIMLAGEIHARRVDRRAEERAIRRDRELTDLIETVKAAVRGNL